MLTTGTLMFYGGIGGIGLSLIIGLITFGWLHSEKREIKNRLEKHYKNTNTYR